MILVQPADEPGSFDETVRQPGLRALSRRVGEKLPGGGRSPKNTYSRREDIPSEEFPTEWRKAIPDLMAQYKQLCAYSVLYIEAGTGSATVDHFIPVSSNWQEAYNWSNYRLACGLINTKKGRGTPLDPFNIEDTWFALELVGFQVVPGPTTVEPLRTAIDATINVVLDLNNHKLRTQRSDYAVAYRSRDISYAYLERRAPLVARELQRQNELLPADQTPVTP